MTKPTILVTGATGKTGAHVVDRLIGKGFPVRALVHRADERAERLAERGVGIVVGDLLDIAVLRTALRSVERAFFVYPPADRLPRNSETSRSQRSLSTNSSTLS